jgi:hypothetical protein
MIFSVPGNLQSRDDEITGGMLPIQYVCGFEWRRLGVPQLAHPRSIHPVPSLHALDVTNIVATW